jgi:hypothetical protein
MTETKEKEGKVTKNRKEDKKGAKREGSKQKKHETKEEK